MTWRPAASADGASSRRPLSSLASQNVYAPVAGAVRMACRRVPRLSPRLAGASKGPIRGVELGTLPTGMFAIVGPLKPDQLENVTPLMFGSAPPPATFWANSLVLLFTVAVAVTTSPGCSVTAADQAPAPVAAALTVVR